MKRVLFGWLLLIHTDLKPRAPAAFANSIQFPTHIAGMYTVSPLTKCKRTTGVLPHYLRPSNKGCIHGGDHIENPEI
jgi:hypothetical protein